MRQLRRCTQGAIALILVLATGSVARAVTVTAAWDPNTDGVTTGYRLYYGTAPGTYGTDVPVGNVTSRVLDLSPGTYYFTVRAYDAANQLGPAASELMFTITAPAGTPTAQVTGTFISPGTASLTWATTNATSANINGTAVPLSGTGQTPISTTTTFTLTATGPGGTATSSTTVAFPVDCVLSAWSFDSATAWGTCSGGQQTRTETWLRTIITPPANGGLACGPLQEQRTASQTCTDPSPILAPGAPTNPRASVSGTRVSLNWNVPLTGGAPAAYILSVGTSPGASNLVNNWNMGNVLSVSGDVARGQYYARLWAANAAGMGPVSTEVAFRVGARTRPRSPLGPTASLHGSTAVVAWSPPAGAEEDAPVGYIIEAGSVSGLTNLGTVPVGNTTRFQARVPPGAYYVRVRAYNELGLGSASTEILLRHGAGPGAPRNLVDSGSGGMLALQWRAPNQSGRFSGYVVEIGSAPDLADLSVMRLGNVTSFTTVVSPGVYYVRVRSVDSDGVAGAASEEIIVRR